MRYALQVSGNPCLSRLARSAVGSPNSVTKLRLAYSAARCLRMDTGLDGGYFGAYIGCSPEKAKKAISMLETEFKKLQDAFISEEELSRAQNYLIGRHDIELQRNSNITSSILFDQIYGIDYRETYRFSDHIRCVTRESVRELRKARSFQAARPRSRLQLAQNSSW